MSAGYVYALAFDSGGVKVGRTQNIKRRLRTHRCNARRFGLTVTNEWASPLHLEWNVNEETLKRLAAKLGGTPLSPEYFNGTDYAALVSTAATLPFTPPLAKVTDARMDAIRTGALDAQIRLTADAARQEWWETFKAVTKRKRYAPESEATAQPAA